MPECRIRRFAAFVLSLVAPALVIPSLGQVASGSGADEAGPPLIRSFTSKVYHASPQNWAAVQDSRGILYIANTDGVIEYDGVTWRRLPIANNSSVRALAIADNGRLYVGGQGDFGYLEPEASGSPGYHSLRGLVPRDAGSFNDIWSVIPTPSGIYFGAYQAIFRWVPGQHAVRVWKPATRFGRLVQVASGIYVTSEGEGLLRLQGDEFRPVSGGETFSPADTRTLIDSPKGTTVVTRKSLYALGNGLTEKMTGGPETQVGEGSIYSAQRLRGGLTALATTLSGVLFLYPGGGLAGAIAKQNGLLTNSATSLFEDSEGGLWITSGAGIDRADLAMTRFAQGEGLVGPTYAVVRHEGRIYAGTSQGLFVLNSGRGGIAVFEPVKGMNETVFAAISTRHGLIVGGPKGLFLSTAAGSSLVFPTAFAFDASISLRDPDVVYVASRYGLNSLRRSGKTWKQERSFRGSGVDFRSVLEDSDGRVWVATQKDVLRVDWSSPEGIAERFGTSAGVPVGFKNVFRIRGQVVFATPRGLLTFHPAEGRFLPWNDLGAEFGTRPVSTVREIADGRIWITGDGYHGELRPKASGGWNWRPMPLGRAELGELYAVLPEADGTVWAAGTDGFLVRYSPAQQPPAAPFGVLVRRVQSQAGPVVYDGSGELKSAPRIGFGDNSLRFEYAAPYMQDPAKVEYQVKLEGADTIWSAWSLETRKDYTHLWEGSYRFLVKARNPAGKVSNEAGFAFEIRAPWYRTWPAYVFYLLAAGSSMWGLLKWRVSKLEAEKAKLEQTVEERTVEIRQQRDQIQEEQEKSETLLLNILPASVAEELKGTGTVQPQSYDDVTVCFTDFAGFTLSSEALPAGNLVSALHEYFTAFDEIVEEFGLEKLKTIGDSYMLVSGLPKQRAAHAVDAVLAALKMVEAVAELAERGEGPVWSVRIGLHSGPVSAGVVGVRKFAFDIWGNTVNLASRMESSGSVGRVNLSETTWALVRDFIECEARGQVQTKDKRDLRMYFACGVRPDLAEPGEFARQYRERFGEEPGYQIPAAKKVVL